MWHSSVRGNEPGSAWYKLLMTCLLARSDISNKLQYLVNGSVRRSDRKNLLDIWYNWVNCLVAIPGDHDQAVNVLFESWEPIWIECSRSGRGSFVTKSLCMSKHARVEWVIADCVLNPKLHERTLSWGNPKALARKRIVYLQQTLVAKGYVDTAQFNKRRRMRLSCCILLALFNLLPVIYSLCSWFDARNELCELCPEIVHTSMIDLEEEESFRLLRKPPEPVFCKTNAIYKGRRRSQYVTLDIAKIQGCRRCSHCEILAIYTALVLNFLLNKC